MSGYFTLPTNNLSMVTNERADAEDSTVIALTKHVNLTSYRYLSRPVVNFERVELGKGLLFQTKAFSDNI